MSCILKRGEMMQKVYYPLNSAFMVTSILGFLVSIFYVGTLSTKWQFTFSLFFFLMFVASMISMTYGPSRAD